MGQAKKTAYGKEKSVRLTLVQAERLELAASKAGIKPSELIREAIEHRCDELLDGNLAEDWAGSLGVLGAPSSSVPARRSADAFGEAMLDKHAPRNRRTRR